MGLTDSLIAYWTMNETSNGSAPVTRVDVHGGNNLTDNNNCPSAATGLIYPNDLDLSAGKALTHADNAALSMGNIDFTFGAWVKLSSKAANRPIMTKGDGPDTNTEYELSYSQADDRWKWVIYGANGLNNRSLLTYGSSTPTIGAWTFLLAWYDSTDDHTYMSVNDGTVENGELQALGAWDGSADFAAAFQFGTNDVFLGEMGPLMIWKRLMTAPEITQLYNGGAGLTYAAMAGTGRRFLLVR
jgi:hypothetical protein